MEPTGFVNYNFEEDVNPIESKSSDLNAIDSQPIVVMDKKTEIAMEQPAISVRNAYKSYKSRRGPVNILNNFNMTVQQGTIYSLLGSSGCGKTTILSCCVGLKDLDKGEVSIFGAKPGTKASGVPGRDVGYMPQETALYMELTIKEALQYFGRMFGMSFAAINKSVEFLIRFLALPPPHRRIGSLSGGQMRRLSFAIALVHSPKLMILDEPTVGVDPLLRQSIWNHLVKLVSTGLTTVIITTHYIQEASRSNQIGLMRGGRILAEDSPESLLKFYNTNLLEDIVLKLCLEDNCQEDGESISSLSTSATIPAPDVNNDVIITKQKPLSNYQENILTENIPDWKGEIADIPQFDTKAELTGIRHRNSIDFQDQTKKSDQNVNEFQKRMSMDMLAIRQQGKSYGGLGDSVNRINAMAVKNVIFLLRNIPFLLFMIIVPASQIVVICIAIGQDPLGLKFGLVNFDVENASDCHSGVGCVAWDNYTGSIGCQYLKILERHGTLDLKVYETEEEAALDVEKSKSWGYLMFPANYTNAMKDRAIFGSHAEPETIHGSRIKFRLDQSNLQIYRETAKVFLQSFGEYMRHVAEDCNIDPASVELPFYFDKPIFGDDTTTFTDFLAPSIFLAVIFFFPLCGSGISYITEKKSGTLARILVAGMTSSEVMLAYLLVQLVILFVQTVVSFAIMNYVFKIQIAGPLYLAFILCMLVGIAGMSMGFLLATICEDEIQAILISLGTFVPHLLLSGNLWPLQGMHWTLQYFSYILPCTLAAEGLRSILSRGVGFTHDTVWPGFTSIIIWIFVYWILTIIIHKLSSKK